MDYRLGVRIARALADGEAACVAVLDEAGDLPPGDVESFARGQNLREWLVPLLDSERARERLGAQLVEQLEERREALPRERQALLELSVEIRSRYAAAGIPCLFLKGLGIAERFYGDVHRRHQFDVDVLVPPRDFEPALAALAPLGFASVRGRPLERRLEKIRSRRRTRAPQTVTLRRDDGLKVDLHRRLKGRLFPGFDEEGAWADRRGVAVMGEEFETLADERMLTHLLLSICGDLRRGGSRAKHFLDLYLILRAFGDSAGGLGWGEFLDRRRAEGVGRPVATALAVFLSLWECADELPELVRCLAARWDLVSLGGADEALALVTRPRRHRANRLWFARLAAGPSLRSAALRLLFDRGRAPWLAPPLRARDRSW